MVDGMRADCLIVDSRPREEPFTLTWAHCLDSGTPPGQPAWPAQAALTASQQPKAPKSTPKVIKIKP